jgi:hypothetical protein
MFDKEKNRYTTMKKEIFLTSFNTYFVGMLVKYLPFYRSVAILSGG